MQENVIAFLPTGAGKTLIAALLIQRVAEGEPAVGGRPIFFVAPSVPLVTQQTKYLQDNTTGLDITSYTGQSGEDIWQIQAWETLMGARKVLVLTPMVLYHLLTVGFASLQKTALLVYDECHHTTKRHPYNLIFRDFYFDVPEKDRPRVLGLTASPVGVSIGSTEPREVNSCDLCRVVFTSKAQEKRHLAGQRHKKKQQRARTGGLHAPPARQPLDGIISKSDEEVIEDLIIELEANMDCRIAAPPPELTAASDRIKTQIVSIVKRRDEMPPKKGPFTVRYRECFFTIDTI